MFTSLINNKKFSLAENPIWDEATNGFFFIDINAKTIHHVDLSTSELKTWQLYETIGCMALADDGNAIVGLSSGIYHYNLNNESLTFIDHPIKDYPKTVRYNEGKVSPDGYFWFSSMDESSDRAPIASLFCLTPEGDTHKVSDSIRVGNGIAFDETRDRIYYSDTRAPGIFVGTYSTIKANLGSGHSADFELFLEVNDDVGRPDGCAIDSEGNYWSAGVSAGRLNCFSPEAKLLHSFDMPCDTPTMPCFGGKDLNQLIITSLDKGDTGNDNNGKIFVLSDDNVQSIGKGSPRYRMKTDT